ncbi:MAG: hypothetical protein AAF694_30580 [Bacteroidota bacterium]
MKKMSISSLILLGCLSIWAQKPKISGNKKAVITSVGSRHEQLSELSDEIWSYEEIAFQETQSAEALAAYARAQGFEVKMGVAEIPTALIAE